MESNFNKLIKKISFQYPKYKIVGLSQIKTANKSWYDSNILLLQDIQEIVNTGYIYELDSKINIDAFQIVLENKEFPNDLKHADFYRKEFKY